MQLWPTAPTRERVARGDLARRPFPYARPRATRHAPSPRDFRRPPQPRTRRSGRRAAGHHPCSGDPFPRTDQPTRQRPGPRQLHPYRADPLGLHRAPAAVHRTCSPFRFGAGRTLASGTPGALTRVVPDNYRRDGMSLTGTLGRKWPTRRLQRSNEGARRGGRRAAKALSQLPAEEYEPVGDAIRALVSDPPPQGWKKLVGRDGWRTPIGRRCLQLGGRPARMRGTADDAGGTYRRSSKIRTRRIE